MSARLICDLLALSGVHQVVTIDVHATQIEGFFSGPFENVSGLPHLIPAVQAREGSDVVVVSPDEGGSKRATKFARLYERASSGFVQSLIMSKVRPGPGQDPVVSFSGGRELVRGQNCVIVDDMIDSGGSVIACARELKNAGAARVVVCATHAVLSGDARERLERSGVIDAVYITDTIEASVPRGEFWQVISLAPLVREVLRRLSHEGGSLSDLRERIDLGELLPAGRENGARTC